MVINELLKTFDASVSLELKENTKGRYLDDLRIFGIFFRNSDISSIKEADIVNYFHLLKSFGYKHNAIVKKTRSIKRFFDWAYKRGYPIMSPELLPRMRQEATMPRIATAEEVTKLLNAIPLNRPFFYYRDQTLIRMLWDTGARNGELMSLNVGDIDLVQMKAVIRTEKSRGMKPFREIYWTKETNVWIKHWLKERARMFEKKVCEDPEALWLGSTNNHYGRRLSNHALCISLRKYSRAAGISTLNPHSFRHHMGHNLSNKGANNSIISSVLGHSRLESSFIYTELTNKEREGAYNKFIRGQQP